MKAVFNNNSVKFIREENDPKFHGIKAAKGEHGLFRFITKWLNAHGFDVIKKRAQKDGHMLGDEFQPYIRTRKPSKGVPHVMIYSGFYALRGANEDWNKGEVVLQVEYNCFGKYQDTLDMIKALGL